jgi:hypothetical protein
MGIDGPVLCLIRHIAREAALFSTGVQEYHQPKEKEASTFQATEPAGDVEDWHLEDKHHKARGEFFIILVRIWLKYGRNLSRSTKKTPRA